MRGWADEEAWELRMQVDTPGGSRPRWAGGRMEAGPLRSCPLGLETSEGGHGRGGLRRPRQLYPSPSCQRIRREVIAP